MIDLNLLKVIFWTFSFNMVVPYSLKVPLVELSSFDTGLYKLGSMRYMAEKTSTNVYRCGIIIWNKMNIFHVLYPSTHSLKDIIVSAQSLPGSVQPSSFPRRAPSCCSGRESLLR